MGRNEKVLTTNGLKSSHTRTNGHTYQLGGKPITSLFGLTNGNGLSDRNFTINRNKVNLDLTNHGLKDLNGLTNGNGLTIGKRSIIDNKFSYKKSKIKNVKSKAKRNNILCVFITFLLIFIPFNIYFWDLNNPNYNNISIDGEFDDWVYMDLDADVYEDQEENVNVNIINYEFLDDVRFYSFYLEVYGILFNGVKRIENEENINGLDTIHIFIDTDNDKTTGYYVKNIGSDYLIELEGLDNEVHRSTLKEFDESKNHNDWNGWLEINSDISYGLNNNKIEIEISKTYFKNHISNLLTIYHIQDIDGNEDFTDEIIDCGQGFLLVKQDKSEIEIIQKNSKNNVITKFNFETKNKDIKIKSLQLTQIGTASDSDINCLKLIKNNKIVAKSIPKNNNIIFELEQPLMIKKNKIIPIEVAVDLSTDAIDSKVIGFKINNKNDITLESKIPIIIESNPSLIYIENVSNQIKIDGAFLDWSSIESQHDEEYDAINNNINIVEFKNNNQNKTVSFYLKVKGEMLGGCSVPFVRESKLVQELVQNQKPERKPITLNNNINFSLNELNQNLKPEIKGEDFVHLYLDIDQDPTTGMPIFSIGSDYMIVITGRYGEIISNKYYAYDKSCWLSIDIVPSACDHSQIELQLDSELLSIDGDFDIIYRTSSWNGEVDYNIEPYINKSGSFEIIKLVPNSYDKQKSNFKNDKNGNITDLSGSDLLSSGTRGLIEGKDYGGTDLILNDGDVLNGTYSNIRKFEIPNGVTVYVNNSIELTINAELIFINGTLSATGNGSIGGTSNGGDGTGLGAGLGGTSSSSGGGGAYGGAGGSGAGVGAGLGGNTYGSANTIKPPNGNNISMGSGGGGGAGNGGGNGGNGGGSIFLNASSRMYIDGTVTADGDNGGDGTGSNDHGGGGGSGGGILLFLSSVFYSLEITPNGILSASGGNGGCGIDNNGNGGGSGGGGRIKIVCYKINMSGSYNVSNGSSGTGGISGLDGNPGLPGTYYLNQFKVVEGLDLKGSDFIPLNGTILKGIFSNVGTFEIKSGRTVYIHQGTKLEIHANNLIINGTLDGNGMGYSGGTVNSGSGQGPGAGTGGINSGGGGGGYGGSGGSGGGSQGGIGGSTYGDMNTTHPPSGNNISLGSGGAGGDGNNGGSGGNGGGSVFLNASNTLIINGNITVNGQNGRDASNPNQDGGGGGSGGGILLYLSNVNSSIFINSSASLSAIGGSGGSGTAKNGDGGGGGGGGRIKIVCYKIIMFGNINVTNGTFGTGGNPINNGNPGINGTYFEKIIPEFHSILIPFLIILLIIQVIDKTHKNKRSKKGKGVND